MTQENKLEWIKELAQELTEACNEQDLTLTMMITSNENNVATAGICGHPDQIEKNFNFLKKLIEREKNKSIIRNEQANKKDSLLGFLAALGIIAELVDKE